MRRWLVTADERSGADQRTPRCGEDGRPPAHPPPPAAWISDPDSWEGWPQISPLGACRHLTRALKERPPPRVNRHGRAGSRSRPPRITVWPWTASVEPPTRPRDGHDEGWQAAVHRCGR